MNTSEASKPRKRHRIPVSCLACRKRKAKCDRGRPHCANCVAKNLIHLCHYEESPWFVQA
ncbi:hypothetical protein BABINDRAFT_41973, partial [Babjeviella inositovora NRRL Y-12698]